MAICQLYVQVIAPLKKDPNLPLNSTLAGRQIKIEEKKSCHSGNSNKDFSNSNHYSSHPTGRAILSSVPYLYALFSLLQSLKFSLCSSRAWALASILSRFRNHRHNTAGVTPLGLWWAHRRILYLTTHNTHKRHTSMSLVGFEPAIPVSKRSQTDALHRAASEIGICYSYVLFDTKTKCLYIWKRS
jgi:hypothetical protein